MKTMSIQDGDIHLNRSGNIALAEGAEGLRQKLISRLRLSRGEWFLDVRDGVPYLQRILGRKVGSAPVEGTVSQIFDTEILKEDEVRSILTSSATYLTSERKFSYIANLDTIYGSVSLEVADG